MKLKIFVFLLFLWSAVLASPSQALPSIESLQGIIPLCAGGRSIEVQGSLTASLQKWLTKASAEGKGNLNDIGAIIQKTKDDKVRVEALSVYHDCVKDMVRIFLEVDAKQDARENQQQEPTTSETNIDIDIEGTNNKASEVGNANGGSGSSKSNIDLKIKGNNNVLNGIGNAN